MLGYVVTTLLSICILLIYWRDKEFLFDTWVWFLVWNAASNQKHLWALYVGLMGCWSKKGGYIYWRNKVLGFKGFWGDKDRCQKGQSCQGFIQRWSEHLNQGSDLIRAFKQTFRDGQRSQKRAFKIGFRADLSSSAFYQSCELISDLHYQSSEHSALSSSEL